MNVEFWRSFARDQKISSIIFDQHFYEILEEKIGISSDQATPIEEESTEAEANLVSKFALEQKTEKALLEAHLKEEGGVQLTEDFLKSAAQQLHNFCLKGKRKSPGVWSISFFRDYKNRLCRSE